VYSQDTPELFVSIEQAIKAVVLGADFHSVYIPSLKALCQPLGIPLGKLEWIGGVSQIDWNLNWAL